MQRLLYDTLNEREISKPNGARLPLGFFRSDKYSHVSAVIYSALATFGKARALSLSSGEFLFHAARIRDNQEIIRILMRKDQYKESLTDGLRLFINPFAQISLDPQYFNDTGIKIFVADQSGHIRTTNHPEGDLCMRYVIHAKTKTSRRDLNCADK